MCDTRRQVNRVSQRFFWSILIVLTTTTGLQADHNKLLQLEFKRGISRHLARDSEGFCYLLLPSPGPEGGVGFTLKVSRKPHPESMSDLPTLVTLPTSERPDATGTSIFSAGIAVDARDRLHLIVTSKSGQTAYSVVDTKRLRSRIRENSDGLLVPRPNSHESGYVRSGRARPKWLNPVTGQEGVLELAPRHSWAGDICRAADGRVWLAWTVEDAKRLASDRASGDAP